MKGEGVRVEQDGEEKLHIKEFGPSLLAWLQNHSLRYYLLEFAKMKTTVILSIRDLLKVKLLLSHLTTLTKTWKLSSKIHQN